MNTTIIGSGVAAWTLVRELRKADPEAEIRLITADSGDFYSKPMLSNALAGGIGVTNRKSGFCFNSSTQA